jgi:hypothetical protein
MELTYRTPPKPKPLAELGICLGLYALIRWADRKDRQRRAEEQDFIEDVCVLRRRVADLEALAAAELGTDPERDPSAEASNEGSRREPTVER